MTAGIKVQPPSACSRFAPCVVFLAAIAAFLLASAGEAQEKKETSAAPTQTVGHKMNPPEWVDFQAPPGRKLTYRVVALTGHPEVGNASAPSEPIFLPKSASLQP